MLTLIHNPCRKKKFPDENLLLIETVFYLGREYIKFNEDYLIITRFCGARIIGVVLESSGGRLLGMCHGLFCSSNLVVFNPKNGYCSY